MPETPHDLVTPDFKQSIAFSRCSHLLIKTGKARVPLDHRHGVRAFKTQYHLRVVIDLGQIACIRERHVAGESFDTLLRVSMRILGCFKN